MDRIYEGITKVKTKNCCHIIRLKNATIGTIVTVELLQGNHSTIAVDMAKLHNSVLKTGLEVASELFLQTTSFSAKLSLYGLVYRNVQVFHCIEEYRTSCASSYDQIISQPRESVEKSRGIASNFTQALVSKIENERRHRGYSISYSSSTRTAVEFRRARLCQSQSFVGTKVTVTVTDEVFRIRLHSKLYKLINEAIFTDGIRHINSDHFTFLRLGQFHTLADC
ncbi:hypothetical protein FBUS_10597 [Fasciolopsis buskii]|uniref:Uncharacterized protein n=1 Tax=Fasciolopsis buskii TaxID=27845 RepID=A0A8E0RUX9_9TREM|nr:hypothetical protein FBUS_10597 [Fasciolopsis buski]